MSETPINPAIQPFDFGDLPDFFGQAEAFWLLTSLTYAYAIGIGYLQLMVPPDLKAAHNPDRAADFLERAVRHAYPGPEGEFLIQLARKKAKEGVEAQRAAMKAEEERLAAERLAAGGVVA